MNLKIQPIWDCDSWLTLKVWFPFQFQKHPDSSSISLIDSKFRGKISLFWFRSLGLLDISNSVSGFQSKVESFQNWSRLRNPNYASVHPHLFQVNDGIHWVTILLTCITINCFSWGGIDGFHQNIFHRTTTDWLPGTPRLVVSSDRIHRQTHDLTSIISWQSGTLMVTYTGIQSGSQSINFLMAN